MREAKEGFVFHTISKVDAEGWHTFQRVDTKRGVVVRYESDEPLQVQVPVTEETQVECLNGYGTRIGGEQFSGMVGAIGRFSLHDLESLFGSMKSDLEDGQEMTDEDAIRARVLAWIPWQGNGGRKTITITAEEADEVEMTPAVKAFLRSKGMQVPA